MNQLVMKALRKADEIRRLHKYNMYEPINVFDLCSAMNLTVMFVDVNMEGMYISKDNNSFARILISSQRPLPRRVFTCAHELGHHLFAHGTKVDELSQNGKSPSAYDSDELLVDSFAGALLMPIAGVLVEFAKRNWDIKSATPIQFYTIASIFGTGYQSLICHCQKNNIINDYHAKTLVRQKPADILTSIIGKRVAPTHFKLIDNKNINKVIDLEVTNFIMLPKGINVEGRQLTKYSQTVSEDIFIAKQPGIARVLSTDKAISAFIRVQNLSYAGIAEYRHLENSDE